MRTRFWPALPVVRSPSLVCLLSGIALGLALLLIGPHARAEEPSYEFMWVKTLLGPCCGDSGQDLAVDAEGAVFVAGHRDGLDLDRNGSVDVKKFGGVWDSLVFKVVGFKNTKSQGEFSRCSTKITAIAAKARPPNERSVCERCQ